MSMINDNPGFDRLNYMLNETGMTIREMARTFGVPYHRGYSWVKQAGVQTRSRGQLMHDLRGNHIELTQFAKEALYGMLMGDGGMYSQSPYSAYFSVCNKSRGVIRKTYSILRRYGIEKVGRIWKKDSGYGKTWVLATRSYAEFLPIRQQFYPEGVKVIPEDLRLTPTVCLYWFLGDGNRTRKAGLRLATNCFTAADIDFTIDKFEDLDIVCSKHKAGIRTDGEQAYVLYIKRESRDDFFDYIGVCPLGFRRTLGHRWDRVVPYTEEKA